MNRRSFLRLVGVGGAAAALPLPASASEIALAPTLTKGLSPAWATPTPQPATLMLTRTLGVMASDAFNGPHPETWFPGLVDYDYLRSVIDAREIRKLLADGTLVYPSDAA